MFFVFLGFSYGYTLRNLFLQKSLVMLMLREGCLLGDLLLPSPASKNEVRTDFTPKTRKSGQKWRFLRKIWRFLGKFELFFSHSTKKHKKKRENIRKMPLWKKVTKNRLFFWPKKNLSKKMWENIRKSHSKKVMFLKNAFLGDN